MYEEVKKVLAEIEPSLAAHGGGVELVEVTDEGVVRVRLTGLCGGCPMAQVTVSQGIEKTLKEKIKGVKRVEAVR